MNSLFVDSRKMRRFERTYCHLTGWTLRYQDLVAESKRLILRVSMSGDLHDPAIKPYSGVSENHWSMPQLEQISTVAPRFSQSSLKKVSPRVLSSTLCV